jgi:hypothetical protein
VPEATIEAPPRRRETWSIRRIAEEIGGRPIAEFQDDPTRPAPAPYHPGPVSLPRRTAAVAAGALRVPSAEAPAEAEELDPVARVYPPLTRAHGRAWHGAEREHHAQTLETVQAAPEPLEPGARPHRPGPSTRPERIYLHYLLLHLDRLSDHALSYLHRAVSEEVAARQAASPPPADAAGSPARSASAR